MRRIFNPNSPPTDDIRWHMRSGQSARVVDVRATDGYITLEYIDEPLKGKRVGYHADEIGDHFTRHAPVRLGRR